jgi:hypothetical protein
MVMNTKEKEEKRAARQCKQKRHTHISTTLTCFPFSTTMYRRRLTPSSHYRRRRRLFPFYFFNSAGMNPKIPNFVIPRSNLQNSPTILTRSPRGTQRRDRFKTLKTRQSKRPWQLSWARH